ncbi:ABC transporter ATP-binding protein [Cecembia lonarensis]|uniref:Putative siderophore transport system ATP-binding protein YusV n=1 Tax=Cecembia lonarensis (strain CCUG 58316 / KCTC 22772 / LW9) TaxID=1225176 RepID=K1KY23_CECL9|nr:ABC transporter ATP-binding protein [Cecembia lonarensis]EKB49040.1 putative siderophore transport system ATP-binding protein YusV [Cecembia lonarensis LW9]
MASNPIILTASNLNLGYLKGKQVNTIAENLDFALEKGKLTCLLGPNGVGKSTLIKTIMGQLPPLHGQIYLEGKPIQQYGLREISKKIAIVLTDKIRLGSISVRQLVELGRIPHTSWLGKLAPEDQNKVDNAIKATNILYLADRPLTELSDGQLQKVMIARALAQDGEILLLDEPTAHLDLVNRLEIMHLLKSIAREENKAILITTHDLEIAIETADEFWLMPCGSPLVSGLPEDLIIQQNLDLLLPSHQLYFDRDSGKIKRKVEILKINIDGPASIKKWLELALIKNHITTLPEDQNLILKENPFELIFKDGKNETKFHQIKALIDFLKKGNAAEKN